MFRPSVIVTALLVVLAGCNGVGDVFDGSATPDRDTYDVDDPLEPSLTTPASAGLEDDSPPGLTADGLEDSRLLWHAHRNRLDDRPYSTDVETVATGADGSTVFVREQRSRIDFGDDRHAIHEWTRGNLSVAYAPDLPSNPGSNPAILPDGDEVKTEHWFGAEGPYLRLEAENGSVTYLDGYEIPVLPGDWRLQAPLRSMQNATVDRREDRGGTYYVVSADGVRQGSGFVADEPFSLTLHVTPAGLIERYRLEGTVRVDGEDLRLVETGWVYGVGESSPERPDWYEDAVEAVSEETPADENGTDGDTPTDENGSVDEAPVAGRLTDGTRTDATRVPGPSGREE